MKLSILVMSAGSIPGASVILALREQKEMSLRIVAADMEKRSAGFLLSNSHYVVPPANSAEFIQVVREICRKEDVAVVFPIIDEELQIFADHAEVFLGDGVRVITNSPETVRMAKDKYLTARHCIACGVRTPRLFSEDELDTEGALCFPLVVKPRDGRGSVGVQIVHSREELDFYRPRLPNPIVQEFIKGTEYTIDVLTDFTGNLISLVPKERIAVKSGMQTKGRTVKDQRLLDYGAEITRIFRLWPRGNVQCIEDQDRNIWLIEANPKFPASLSFTVAAGVNAPLLLLKMHLGKQVDPMLGQFRENLTMIRIWRELYS